MVGEIKVLLNVFTTDLQESDFIELSNPYTEKGYSIFNFQFDLSDYYLDMVDTLLNYLSNEHSISPYEVRIVLQSNISNLLIAWYRLYNDVIDDFVLTDRQIVFYQINDAFEKNLILQLSSFVSIENDPCHNRLYFRYSQQINQKLLEMLVKCQRHNIFRPFDEIELNTVFKKGKILKGYNYKNQYYKRVTAEDEVDVIVNLNKGRMLQSEIKINEITHPSGCFYVFIYLLNLPLGDIQRAQYSRFLCQKLTEEDRQKVTLYILNYLTCTVKDLPYKQVINLYSFLVMLGTDKSVVKKMMKYIKEDDIHFDDFYAPFTNSLFYISRENQNEYEDYFLDRIEIMRKLKAYYKPNLKIQANRSVNRLVIVTGQLLSYNHAPTKLVIDYVNKLLQYFPMLKIKIVVEDMFNYSPNELFFVYPFSSADSSTASDEHKKLLSRLVDVHYSNSRLSKLNRLQNDINAITEFEPKWILKMGAPDSLAVDQLYDFYPVASLSMGRAEYSEFVDIYTGGHLMETIQNEYFAQKITNRKYIQHNVGINFKFPEKRTKSQISLNEGNFVLVSVGNRLEAEFTEEFVHIVADVLRENISMVWCIVGASSLSIVDSICGKLNINGQVKYFNYVTELMNFYTACDVYINPFRKTGGNSAAMAMRVGLPVVSLDNESDVIAFIGKENGVTEDLFGREIEKLYLDSEYYQLKSKLMRDRLETRFNFEQTVVQIMDILNQTEAEFEKRN